MLWLIQKNFYSERNLSILKDVLRRLNITSIEVEINESKDKIKTIQNIDENNIFHTLIANDSEVNICGGNALSKIAQENNWKPGSFLNENFDYVYWRQKFKDKLLNYEVKTSKLQDIESEWDEFFIRPVNDTKYFCGQIVNKNNFNSWRERILNYSNGKHIGNSIVAASPVKKIYAEYRFFAVDNNIVTYSQYKSGEQVYMSEEVPSLAVNFVKEMIEIWQPARAFVIDVAYTPDGYKIVEFNNINASGFYACNVQKIVESIEYMNKDI